MKLGFGRKNMKWGTIDRTYYCGNCHKRHRLSSVIGIAHQVYEKIGW